MASVPKVEEQACENTAWNRKQEKPPDFANCCKEDSHRAESKYRTNKSATHRNPINSNLCTPLRFLIKKWGLAGAAENNRYEHADKQSREHDPPKDGFRNQNEHDNEQHDNNADRTVDLSPVAQEVHAHMRILRAIRSALAVTFVT
jgi:hypothetical protein